MNEVPKSYEPQSVEDKWYDFWVKQGCFTADPARVTAQRPAYAIVIPPPNVTGMLHMGHVLNNTIQDILSRKARMDGKEVLWLPGTDHAGIATEGMVAKQLRKDEKKTKQDIGREEFIKRVWTWKEKHGGIIIQQLKKLGCSCDWTRERFTMDPDYARNVQRVFVDLYKKGLIYRGKRMVNWCPATQTALSDEEVEMKPQKGFMYHFKVQVADCSGAVSAPNSAVTDRRYSEGDIKLTDTWLTIATTRPETIPGDTAVAVNPKDPRYAHLIGKHIIRPLPAELPREQKLIPIIGDEHVDFEFGTGVLKVTPAHDKADFDIGQRHKLPIVDIMSANGTMNELAGESLAGLDRFEARAIAVERLKELGVLVEEKPYENNVGFSQRADVPIEPRLSEQWFLKYPSVAVSKACVEQPGSTPAPGVADRALAVSSGAAKSTDAPALAARAGAADGASAAAPEAGAVPKMRFHPDRWAKVYDHWLSNIQDWCISRQLWWGHRVPVWRKSFDCFSLGSVYVDVSDLLSLGVKTQEFIGKDSSSVAIAIDGKPVSADAKKLLETGVELQESDTEIREIEAQVCTVDTTVISALERQGWQQDPDVLDTWFSSWLWPFATMGWTGDKASDANAPTLRAFYPTTDLVTGPDIIFFWVARMIMAGYEYMGDLPFKNVYFTGIIRDKQGRKMSKTLGNSPDPLELIAKYGADALRFGTMRSAPLGQDVLFDEKDVELGRNFCNKLWNACRFRQMQGGEVQGEINAALLSSDDRWILLRLDQAIREVSDALAGYNFATAVQTLYRFFWSEYCDWYVEASKAAFFGEDATLKANKVAVIDFVLSHLLRMFHPLLPFITEELWHGMGYSADMPEDQGGKTVMFAHWPKPLSDEEKLLFGIEGSLGEQVYRDQFTIQKLVYDIRALRTQFNIGAGKKLRLIYHAPSPMPRDIHELICRMTNAESVEHSYDYQPPKGTPVIYPGFGNKLFLPLDGLVDTEAERARLTKELAKIQSEIEKVEQKLANPSFAQKVPPAVLEEHRQRLADWQTKLAQTKAAIEALG
ncbi:MAG: valine--tRNA ligase [Limisphaerales bacterium]